MAYPAEYQAPQAPPQGTLGPPGDAADGPSGPQQAPPVVAAVVRAVATATGATRCAVVVPDDTGGPHLLQPVIADGDEVEGSLLIRIGWESLPLGLGWPHARLTPLSASGRRVGALITDGATLDTAALDAISPILGIAVAHIGSQDHAQDRVARAEERARVATDLVAVVSHELRSPLTSIIGALQTVQRLEAAPPGSDAAQIVESASARAVRLHDLVDDLLIAVRPERVTRLSRARTVQLESLVSDAIAAVPGGEAVAVEVATAQSPVTVDADGVHRILVNLIDNALRHGGSNVTVSAVAETTTLRVSVTDDGPGLPDQVAADLATTGPAAPLAPIGSGLGLTIARGLAAALDGTLDHDSSAGTTFTLTVPLVSAGAAVV